MDYYNFFLNNSPDDKGRMFFDILEFKRFNLEHCHNYIQKLFPSNMVSLSDPSSPIISCDDVKKIRDDEVALRYIRFAFYNMLYFWRIDCLWEKEFSYFVSKDFKNTKQEQKIKKEMKRRLKPKWVYYNNHNYRRITRVLHFLKLLGMQKKFDLLLSKLEMLILVYPAYISKETIEYWRREKD